MPNWKTYESSVRLLSAILAAHPDLKLNYTEISRAFGGDCTKWAIDNRFRSLKTDAKKIMDALAAGQDPGNLDIPSASKGREIAEYYGDCTKYALDHRFRDIKKMAAAMRAAGPGNPIADKYEQGVTPKAVQMRFERLKKEPDWLGNDANGDASSAAPKAKNPRTPKKNTAKKNIKEEDGDDDEDDDEADISPLKFTPDAFNKTKGGRVIKTPRKAALKAPKYVQEDNEKEEDDGYDDMYGGENAGAIMVKNESNDYGASFSNGNGHANGHANGNGYADDDEEEVYHQASSNMQYGNGYDEDAV